MSTTVGHRIESVLKESGMTIAEFSRRVNMTPQNVHKIFKRESIDTALLQKIGGVLKHDFFQYFVSDQPIPTKQKRKYKVTVMLEIDDDERVDEILTMAVGAQVLKQLKR